MYESNKCILSRAAKGLKAEPCYLFSPLTSRVNESFIIKSCVMQYCSGKNAYLSTTVSLSVAEKARKGRKTVQ